MENSNSGTKWIWGLLALTLLLLGFSWFLYVEVNTFSPVVSSNPMMHTDFRSQYVNSLATLAEQIETNTEQLSDQNGQLGPQLGQGLTTASNIYGPEAGVLELATNASMVAKPIGVRAKNFAIYAKFKNPVNPAISNWDYGYLFRHFDNLNKYRIWVSSTGAWQLSQLGPSGDTVLAEGTADSFDAAPSADNTLLLIIQDNNGSLIVNNSVAGEFELSADNSAIADIFVASGIAKENRSDDTKIPYSYLNVWTIENDTQIALLHTATPIPSPTLQPTPTARATPRRTPTPNYVRCPGLLRSRLQEGDTATVDIFQLAIRDDYRENANRKNVIAQGREVELLEGPICGRTRIWWRIRFEGRLSSGKFLRVTGWVSEADHEEYYLRP